MRVPGTSVPELEIDEAIFEDRDGEENCDGEEVESLVRKPVSGADEFEDQGSFDSVSPLRSDTSLRMTEV